MCGIAGYCLNPKEHQRASVADLAGQMLLDIEHRGQHATGSAWINPANGNRVILKAAIPATKFVHYNKDLCRNAQTAILHTRWATQGDPKDNNNNHPIPRGKIVLTHNGHISNDRELFKQLKVARNGKVDSEAVAALLGLSAQHPTELLPTIQGTAALAWIEQGASNLLHLARVNSSPLWIGQTKRGSLVYGSTLDTVENAATMLDTRLDWTYEANEGEYFKVKDGVIVEWEMFKPYRNSFTYDWRNMAFDDDDEWNDMTEHSMLNY